MAEFPWVPTVFGGPTGWFEWPVEPGGTNPIGLCVAEPAENIYVSLEMLHAVRRNIKNNCF